jgi:L-asparaginase
VFCGRIIRGKQAVKVHTSDLDAFRSVNAPQDGQVTADGRVLLANAPEPSGTPRFVTPTPQRLILVRLTPDLDPAFLALLPGAGYDRVVLEAFGAGGVPAYLEQAVKGLLEAGVTVYVTSQCLYGACDLHKYAVGQRAVEMGAICLGARTTEDALAAIACGEI